MKISITYNLSANKMSKDIKDAHSQEKEKKKRKPRRGDESSNNNTLDNNRTTKEINQKQYLQEGYSAERCCKSMELTCVVLVINDNPYRLMFALSYICRTYP
jgi:hypothetical protein